MKTVLRILILSLGTLLALSCSKKEQPPVDEIFGTWESLVINPDGSEEKQTFYFNKDYSYSSEYSTRNSANDSWINPDVASGTFKLNGDILTMINSPIDESSMTYKLESGKLSLIITDTDTGITITILLTRIK